jgi:DUF177 domain-containing protein
LNAQYEAANFMKSREFSQPVESEASQAIDPVDVFELARLHGSIAGRLAFDDAPRLRAELRDTPGAIEFRFEGLTDPQRRPGARLLLRGSLPLRCDRCGGRLDLPIGHRAGFHFVREADELDAAPITVDEETEPLLGSERFDLASLIEDEAILSIPVSPRHASCATAASTVDGAPDPKEARSAHPFATLPALLTGKRR